MRLRIACLIAGFMLLEWIRTIIGADKLANEIQILSAVPIVYTLVRMEIHHHNMAKHFKKDLPIPEKTCYTESNQTKRSDHNMDTLWKITQVVKAIFWFSLSGLSLYVIYLTYTGAL